MQTIPDEIVQQVLENSELVAALERVFVEAKAFVEGDPCVAHNERPCPTCLVGTDWSDLREAVEEAGLLR